MTHFQLWIELKLRAGYAIFSLNRASSVGYFRSPAAPPDAPSADELRVTGVLRKDWEDCFDACRSAKATPPTLSSFAAQHISPKEPGERCHVQADHDAAKDENCAKRQAGLERADIKPKLFKRRMTVRFTASGHLEMAWHLYMWGNAVEVLAPKPLREMVALYRRGDFPALP